MSYSCIICHAQYGVYLLKDARIENYASCGKEVCIRLSKDVDS